MSLLDDFDSLVSPSPATPNDTLLAKFDEAAQPDPIVAKPKPIEPLTWADRVLAKIPNVGNWENWNASTPVFGQVRKGAQGMADLPAGAVQLAAHVTPGIDSSAVDKRINDVEQQYQAGRGKNPGFDWWRTGGNVASALLAPEAAGGAMTMAKGAETAAPVVTQAPNMINKMIAAAKVGGTIGAASPVTEDSNYWLEKAKQVGGGAIASAFGVPVFDKLGQGLGAVANAATNFARPLWNKATGQTESAIDPVLAKLATASPELQSTVKSQVAQGAKVDSKVLSRQLEADSLPIKMSLTEGQATQDPAKFTWEQNNRGQNPDLANRFNDQNKQLIANINEIKKSAAPDVSTPDHVVAGDNLIKAIQTADNTDKATITANYKAVTDANGGQFPMDGQSFAISANKELGDKMKGAFLPSQFQDILEQFQNGKQSMNLENFENLRTMLGAAQRSATDGNTRSALNIVRNNLESMPMTDETAAIKPLADTARQSASDRFAKINDTPALKAVVNGKATPDNFIQKYIVGGNVADIHNLALHLKDDPDALQTMKAGVVDYLKNKALGSAGDNGTFSQNGYNTAFNAMKPKLGVLFNDQEIGQLNALGNVSRYIQFQPKGSWVNNSNTDVSAAARAAGNVAGHLVDRATGTPVGSIANAVVQNAAGQKTKQNTLNAILNTGAGIATPGPTSVLLKNKLPAYLGRASAIPLATIGSQLLTKPFEKRPQDGNQ